MMIFFLIIFGIIGISAFIGLLVSLLWANEMLKEIEEEEERNHTGDDQDWSAYDSDEWAEFNNNIED